MTVQSLSGRMSGIEQEDLVLGGERRGMEGECGGGAGGEGGLCRICRPG